MRLCWSVKSDDNVVVYPVLAGKKCSFLVFFLYKNGNGESGEHQGVFSEREVCRQDLQKRLWL